LRPPDGYAPTHSVMQLPILFSEECGRTKLAVGTSLHLQFAHGAGCVVLQQRVVSKILLLLLGRTIAQMHVQRKRHC